MSISMYSSSVPVLQHFLKNLAHILKKGEEYAAEKKIDETVLTGARLFPDMLPLTKQVQIACDVSKGCAGRLAGIDLPKFDDDESSFAELQARIAKTLEFLDGISAEQINGTEAKEIKLKAGPNELEFVGELFLSRWALPNMYFHVTTAYNILRHNGVQVGKLDFLG